MRPIFTNNTKNELTMIAEIGSNWKSGKDDLDADLDTIMKTIHSAAIAGAQAVKFQLFKADSLYSEKRAPTLHKRTKEYEFPLNFLPIIRAETQHLGIELWTSVFSRNLVSVAAEHSDVVKVASGDLNNYKLITKVSEICSAADIPVAISTGASEYDEIIKGIDTAYKYPIPKLIVFHCKSEYPARKHKINLRQGLNWQTMADELGFSDHTLDSDAAELACAMGYTVFEKHFRIKSAALSPDHIVSLNPMEFITYSAKIRRANMICGNAEVKITGPEENERLWARRGNDGLRPTTRMREK